MPRESRWCSKSLAITRFATLRTAPLALLAFLAALFAAQAEAQEARENASGLPVPRFVSLKTAPVNLRGGPGQDHEVRWVYVRKGLPLEIIAEYDVWRRVRDASGATGWIHKQMLDGQRMALIVGEGNAALREAPRADAGIVAYGAPGLVAQLDECGEAWCRIEAKGYAGWVERTRIFGILAGETIR